MPRPTAPDDPQISDNERIRCCGRQPCHRRLMARDRADGLQFHSTGRLHKIGSISGLFRKLDNAMQPDLPLQERRCTFDPLAQTQAIGSVQPVHTQQRPVVCIALRRYLVSTSRSLVALFTPTKPRRRTPVAKRRPAFRHGAHR